MYRKLFSLRRLDGVNCWWQSRTLEASAVEPPAWRTNQDQLSILSSELNSLYVPAYHGKPGARLLAAIASDFNWASLVCELAGLLQHLISGFNGARYATTDHSAQIIALECEDFEFATNCLQAAAGVISELHCGQGAKVAEEYDRLIALADEVFPELISGPIVEAAKRRGIPAIKLEFLTGFQLGQGIYRRRFCTSNGLTTECTSVIGTFLANDKNVSKSVFEYVNAPYPAGQSVATEDGSVAAANKLGWPVVVKPLDLQCGIGVTANLTNADEVREAFHNARTHTEADEVLVEKHLVGSYFRLLVVDGKLVSAIRRDLPGVLGDGAHTVRELVSLANQDSRRGPDYRWPFHYLQNDESTVEVLREQGRSMETVPASGEFVPLDRRIRTPTGAMTFDVTDQVHPATKLLAENIVSFTGLDVAGLDVVATDIKEPLQAQGGGFIEINEQPGIWMHYPPFCSPARPVAEAVVQMLFPNRASDGRIPLVIAIGQAGADDFASSLANHLQQAGLRTVLSLPQESQFGTLYDRFCSAFLNPAAEAAVVSAPLADIRHNGMGNDYCSVLVLVDKPEQQLEDDPQFSRLLRRLIDMSEYCLVNLDEPFWAEQCELIGPAAIRYSSRADHPLVVEQRESGFPVAIVSGRDVVVQIDNAEFVHPLECVGTLDDMRDGLAIATFIAVLGAIGDMGLKFGETDLYKKRPPQRNCKLSHKTVQKKASCTYKLRQEA